MKPVWEQSYYIWGQGLAVSAIISAIPTAVLLFLLGVKRKAAWVAALWGLGATLVVALVGYRMPVPLLFSSAAYGAAFGLFPISWIVFWAIVLYNVTVATGKVQDCQGIHCVHNSRSAHSGHHHCFRIWCIHRGRCRFWNASRRGRCHDGGPGIFTLQCCRALFACKYRTRRVRVDCHSDHHIGRCHGTAA